MTMTKADAQKARNKAYAKANKAFAEAQKTPARVYADEVWAEAIAEADKAYTEVINQG